MRRLSLVVSIAALLFCLIAPRAWAQTVPLTPDAIDPGVSAAIMQAAQAAEYDYAGDCQTVGAESSGRICSLAFLQRDGGISVQFFTIADDGTAVQPPFNSLSIPASVGLTLLQTIPPGNLPPGALGSPRADLWYYVFRISGPAINGTIGGADGRGVTLQPAVPFSWGRTNDTNVIYLGLAPSTPAATYTVTIALPGGQTISITITHPGSATSSGQPTSSSPTGSAAAPVSRLGAGQLAYDFDSGVSSDDQDTIRTAISIGQQAFGPVGDLTVHVYTDVNALIQVYAQAACGGCVLDDTTRQRWLNGGEGEAFLGHIFLYVATTQWRGWARAQRIHEVVHEYFHTYQNAAYGQRIISASANGPYAAGPVWLAEGSAEYEAFMATDSAGAQSFAEGRQQEQRSARRITLPLQAMETWQQPRATNQTDGPYSVGFFAVEDLASLAGADSIKQYWSAARTAQRWQDAFAAAFGLSADDFYAQFSSYLATQIALPPPALQFAGMVPHDTVSAFPPGGTLYAFSLTGVDDSLGAGAVKVVSGSGVVVSSSWARLSADRLVVYLSPGTPAATYTTTVTLPNGQQLLATFQHAGA